MPISVVCSGCQKRFSVSEKFAGKQGACPNCKAIITVPVPAKDEVKIHVPEDFASGGKDAKGRPTTKPIARKDAKFRPILFAAVFSALAVAAAVAWLARPLADKTALIVAGLVVLGAPIAVVGYSFLRDDELEPYTGRALWLRSAGCALAYAVLWGAYWPVSGYMTGEVYQWLFVAPLFMGAGALAAWATLDIEFGNGALHYGLYLLVTLLLRAALGLPAIWETALA